VCRSPQVEDGGQDPVGVGELGTGSCARGAAASGTAPPVALLLSLGGLERCQLLGQVSEFPT
jgi:hypothetical protein